MNTITKRFDGIDGKLKYVQIKYDERSTHVLVKENGFQRAGFFIRGVETAEALIESLQEYVDMTKENEYGR